MIIQDLPLRKIDVSFTPQKEGPDWMRLTIFQKKGDEWQVKEFNIDSLAVEALIKAASEHSWLRTENQ